MVDQGYSRPQAMDLSKPVNAAPRQQKRLYVGNLPPQLNEAHFMEFLNASMKKVPGLVQAEGNPIIGLDMSSERSYCFIELRTPDEATFFTAFDGLTYEGHSLRVHRPREWTPSGDEPALPPIPPSVLGIVSTTVPDGPNKIFIGGLPTHFNEAEVKEILGTIGQLKAFNLVRDGAGHSRGFAFCEYVDPALTDVVCQSFNGKRYGDRQLVVQRSQPGQKGGNFPDEQAGPRIKDDPSFPMGGAPGGPMGQQMPPQMVVGADGQTVLVNDGPNHLLNGMLNSMVPTDVLTSSVAATARERSEGLQATNIVAFLNALDTSEEWTDDYYNAVCQDFWNEGSRVGKIVRLVVPRAAPKPKKKKIFLMPGELSESDIGASDRTNAAANEPPPPPGHGRIFIEYESVQLAETALKTLAGRKYDGRMILGSFVRTIPS